jgi:hypothetical protein
MDDQALTHACRDVAAHFDGSVGAELFDFYAAINQRFFGGKLPPAFILRAITPYGKCLGLTNVTYERPVILLHPGLKTPEQRFYTLLHEAIHVQCDYLLGTRVKGKTSHSQPAWIAEVNRIAPLLGYDGIELGAPKVRRLPKSEGGGLTRSAPDVPYECTYRFPQALSQHLGQPLPPVDHWLSAHVAL